MLARSIPTHPRGASTRRQMIAGVAAAALSGIAASRDVWARGQQQNPKEAPSAAAN